MSNKNKSDYADFNERFQKILQCDEKPVRVIRLDELYGDVYRYCKDADLTPEILTLYWPLLEDIFRALEDAGGGYPGLQKQVESFLKAINEAKQYAPEKKVAALNAIITNAGEYITNDPRTEKRMQGVITLAERLLAETLPDTTPAAGEVKKKVPSKGMKNFKNMEDLISQLGTYPSHFYTKTKEKAAFLDGKIKQFDGYPGYYIHPKHWSQLKELFNIG